MGIVLALKTKAQRTTRTRVDTIAFTLEEMESWKRPSFQREITVTKKMKQAVEFITESGGVFPGVITLGVIDGTKEIYKIDCHHRCEAFKQTGCTTGYSDVRWLYGTMEDFADEYRRLNEQISPTRPDDRLRAAAVSNPQIEKLRSSCKVVAYGRRAAGERKISVSMSSVLRAWHNASRSIPAARGKAASAVEIVDQISDSDLNHLIKLIHLCESAWGRDLEYAALWGQMNLTMVMWLYTRMVVEKPASVKLKQLSPALFEKCLLSLSADARYVEWLRGRNGGTHRTPCYSRIKDNFARRLFQETGQRHNLPQPEWVTHA
jgi:hypothetical protein